VQWNIGGWGNRLHAVQAADAVVGEQTPGTIETGRWYDIRIEVKDRTVRGFLDGALVQERTLPRIDRVLAVAGRDAASRDIIVKVVNSAPDAQSMEIRLDGLAKPATTGTLTILSGDPFDENTFEAPTKIVPRTSPLRIGQGPFTHTFPAHSLSILRIATK
jgi:alpha-L-arabinofuranosidase